MAENIGIFCCPFVLMAIELRQANRIDRLRHFLGWLHTFLVEGDSMSPTLNNGEIILLDPHASLEVGDLALADHPYRSSVRIIKRIASIEPGGLVSLIGDNAPESTDSRTFGLVSIKSIKGRVVCRLK